LISASLPSDQALQGYFYSGTGSAQKQAALWLDGGRVVIGHDDARLTLSPQGIIISPRVGNAPRYLYLPDGGVFETRDNPAVDDLDRQLNQRSGYRLLHRLESRLGLILLALSMTVTLMAASFMYGIPWASRTVAHALPEDVARQLGQNAVGMLDSYWLRPSQLPVDEQARLRQVFAPYLESADMPPMTVLFRAGKSFGANAMALPDGTLIFTDELVALAEDDKELIAILAHEIGHVVHRHGLQRVVQSSLSAWILVLLSGDLAAFTDAAVAGPVVLINLAYSRDMEREADAYAFAFMQEHRLDPVHFANIMERLGKQYEEDGVAAGILSTHPDTRDRIARFRE